jgi:RNA polymerase sigma-B factor
MSLRWTDRQLKQRGDGRARAELATRYLPLARRLAMRYQHTGEPLDDLVQVASLGLVKAIDRWDPDRGTALSAFAVPTILGVLRQHLRDNTWRVRPPRGTQELFLLATRARNQLWRELGRAPQVHEISTFLGRSYDEVLEAVEAVSAREPGSLDAPLADAGDGDAATLLDRLAGRDPGYAGVEVRLVVDQLAASLTERSREVVRLRYREELHQREIAERIGCSQMTVSRMLRDALETLRRCAEPRVLHEPKSVV